MSKRARQQAHIRALRAENEQLKAGLIEWHNQVIDHLEAKVADIVAGIAEKVAKS